MAGAKRLDGWALQWYVQNVMDLWEDVSPNSYEVLLDQGLLIDVGIEIGVVKPDDPKGKNNTYSAIQACRRIPTIRYLALDEPFSSGKELNLSTEDVVASVAKFTKTLRPLVQEIGLIEQIPNHTAEEIVSYMEELQQIGQSPSFLHLDMDRLAMRNQGIRTWRNDLNTLYDHCFAWGIPFGVILWTPNLSPRDPDFYRREVKRWYRQVMQEILPDRWIVQSWDAVEGHTQPPVDILLQTLEEVNG